MPVREDMQEMSSRRLPPPRAWKHPDDWLYVECDEIGWLRPDIEKFELTHDDRYFVIPDRAVKTVKSLFKDDFTWPYDINDPETAPDIHHFHYEAQWYEPHYFEGSTIPRKFRNTPTNLGRMPRQFHSTLHDLALPPRVPAFEDMFDYTESYDRAHKLFSHLLKAAKGTLTVQSMFPARRQDIARNPERIGTRDFDEIGEAFLMSEFDHHFSKYRQAIDDVNVALEEGLTVPLEYDLRKKRPRPIHVVNALGRVVNRECINYTPIITSQIAA